MTEATRRLSRQVKPWFLCGVILAVLWLLARVAIPILWPSSMDAVVAYLPDKTVDLAVLELKKNGIESWYSGSIVYGIHVYPWEYDRAVSILKQARLAK